MERTRRQKRDLSRETAARPKEPERRESDEQFRELMAHLEQVFWIMNATDDAVLYVSPAYETISGRSCQSLYDDFRTFLAAIHPEERERVAGAMARQGETGGYDEEFRIERPDGAIRWIWARSYPVFDAQGALTRFAGIAEDITERKSLELERARLAAIVEYSEDAIVSMSVNCDIISWNRGAERQYGYTAEEIIGCSLSVLFPSEHYQEYLRILAKVRRGEQVASYDTVRQRKDGTLINASVNIFPIQVRNREIVGASNVSRDVSAIKKLEEQFIAAQKMEVVGHLAAGMAHDFNNVLSVVMGCSDLLIEALGASSPLRKHAETILRAGERAAGLTRELLLFSRRERATPVVVDVNDVVEDLEIMLRHLIDENIDLVVVRGQELARVKLASSYLGQVLLNLVVNARDAMPGGGKLSVTTSNAAVDDDYARSHAGVAAGSYVLLSVSDTGTGMSDEVKAHLFESFYTTKPRGKGTGLGLVTCDTIVKQSGGHIRIDSKVGRGTTIKVYFPAVGEPPDASVRPPRTGARMPHGAETLLVIEPERAVRILACSVLESLGYTVLRATNVDDGLRAALEHRGQPVRLVVTDVNTPHVSNEVAAEWMESAHPDLRVLFTSGDADEAIAYHGVPVAAMAYLPKPYTPTQLAYQVRSLLDHGGNRTAPR